MLKIFISLYKIPVLVSTVTAIAIIALKVVSDPIQLALIFLASFIATIIMDLDYFLYIYVFEPSSEFAVNVKSYITHKDFPGALSYIVAHKNSIEDKTLNSAFFQIILGLVCFFVIFSNLNIFVRTLVLATFANSIYRAVESYIENGPDAWFWSIKIKPSKGLFIFYVVLLFGALSFCLYFL